MNSIFKTVVLSAAQVNALDSTAINLIPAPRNSNQMIVVKGVTFSKLSGTAVGSVSTAPIILVYTGDTTVICGFASAANAQTFLATGTSAATYLNVTKRPAVDGTAYTGAIAKQKGVDITGTGATIGSFDGTVQVTVEFVIMNIGS